MFSKASPTLPKVGDDLSLTSPLHLSSSMKGAGHQAPKRLTEMSTVYKGIGGYHPSEVDPQRPLNLESKQQT